MILRSHSRLDIRHDDDRKPQLSRRDDGALRPSASACWRSGAWVIGVALDATGGPLSPTAWTAAFSVLAAGILLGPVALYWSRTVTPPS